MTNEITQINFWMPCKLTKLTATGITFCASLNSNKMPHLERPIISLPLSFVGPFERNKLSLSRDEYKYLHFVLLITHPKLELRVYAISFIRSFGYENFSGINHPRNAKNLINNKSLSFPALISFLFLSFHRHEHLFLNKLLTLNNNFS